MEFAKTALKFGIQLDHNAEETTSRKGFEGVSITYAKLAFTDWLKSLVSQKTAVILDEPHHLEESEDSAWYQSVINILQDAGIIIMMTGTPWRSGGKGRIPFCEYEKTGKNTYELKPDFSYPYADALRDNIVAKARFSFCKGTAKWTDSKGLHNIDLTRQSIREDQESKVLKALTSADGGFYEGMISTSLRELDAIRTPENNYALLIACNDVAHARKTQQLLLTKFGRKSDLAVGDDSGSHKVIENFKVNANSIIIAVRQVSEGTDIPRIKVICYASLYRTYLFFFQLLGRMVRKTIDKREVCLMVLPAIPTLTLFARLIEDEYTHTIKEVEEREHNLSEGGGIRQEGIFDVEETTYENSEQYEVKTYDQYDGILLTDRRDKLRKECNELVNKYSSIIHRRRRDVEMSVIIREVHRQSNAVLDIKRQESMDIDQLSQKKQILTTWLKKG